MWKMLAVTAVSPFMIAPAAPTYADSDNIDPGANYSVFLQAIAGDGIVMDSHQAILEGQDVCKFMQPPDGGSLWDAGHKILSMHSDWGIGTALHFADRSVQDICPNRGSF
jgi:hypothetical protein